MRNVLIINCKMNRYYYIVTFIQLAEALSKAKYKYEHTQVPSHHFDSYHLFLLIYLFFGVTFIYSCTLSGFTQYLQSDFHLKQLIKINNVLDLSDCRNRILLLSDVNKCIKWTYGCSKGPSRTIRDHQRSIIKTHF